jgi:hypothetical protein
MERHQAGIAPFAALCVAALAWPVAQNLSRWPLNVAIRDAAAALSCAAARDVGLAPAYGGQPGYFRSTIATRTGSPASPGRAGRPRALIAGVATRLSVLERDRHDRQLVKVGIDIGRRLVLAGWGPGLPAVLDRLRRCQDEAGRPTAGCGGAAS